MTVILRLFIVVGCLIGALAAAPVVSADEPAETFNINRCDTSVVGGRTVTMCFRGHGVAHTTETPSGVVSTIEYSDVTSSTTVDGVVTASFDGTNHHHTLVIDGEVREAHQNLQTQTTEIVTQDGETLLVNCGVVIIVHYANGRTQFENTGQGCTAGPA